MSSLPFSSTLEFFSLAAEDSILIQLMNVESAIVIRKLCYYAYALIKNYRMYIVEIEDTYIYIYGTEGRTADIYIYIYTYI